MSNVGRSWVLGIAGAQFASAGGRSCATLPGGRVESWGCHRADGLGDDTVRSRSASDQALDR